MGLKINFGLQVVKWQRWQVSYQNEKSMRIIDFLPGFHWFPGQKMTQMVAMPVDRVREQVGEDA